MMRTCALVAVALVAAPVAAQPRQGWAHKDGLVDLQVNRRGSPEEAIDRLMIRELFSRWGIAFDEGRADVISSLYETNGILESMEGRGKPTLTIRGSREIGPAMVRFQQRQADQRRHSMTNVLVEELTGTRALALAYGIVTVAKDGRLTLGSSVIYRGELAKGADGAWQFLRLQIGMDIYVRDKPITGASR